MEALNINQMVTAAITLTAAGMIGYAIKDIPLRIWKFALRQFTTRLTLTTAHKSYFDVMKYLEVNYKDKNFRDFKLLNGKYGNSDNSTMGIGYGGHFIKFQKMILHIQLNKEASQGTEYDKDSMTITKWGRSRQGFDAFFTEIQKELLAEENIPIFKMLSYWAPINKIPKRPLDTMFIEESKKEQIFNTLDNFINRESWYVSHGIPYHLGILLYGNPGTGKSSLIKVITGYLNYSLYYLPVSKLFNIEEALSSVPKNAIVVIEDIDCDKAIHNREEIEPTPIGSPSNPLSNFSITNFSDVLNAIDGIGSSHGRIIIFTTNHIEKLDPALLRPGRVDLQVEIGFVNNEIFNQFTNKFFGKTQDIKLRHKLTCAELQNLVLQDKSFDEVIQFVKEKQ